MTDTRPSTPFISPLTSWYRASVRRLYQIFLQPRSVTLEDKRHERLSTIILFAVTLLSGLIGSCALYRYFTLDHLYEGISLPITIGIFLVFATLYMAARHGSYRLAGKIFLACFFAGVIYGVSRWGSDMPVGLLSYALFITMASTMLGSRFGLVAAVLSAVAIFVTGLREVHLGITPAWAQVPVAVPDLVVDSLLLFIAAFFSWFSNSEIEYSLARARASESELKAERDNLEATVEARTKALKQAQIDHAEELNRFAEFGKLSAGLFHDLLNPLAAISLSVHTLQEQKVKEEVSEAVTIALRAAKRMEKYVASVRKHLKHDDTRQSFLVAEEIREVITILSFNARRMHVTLTFVNNAPQLLVFGNPIKYNQVVSNLVSNAIESYQETTVHQREVVITLSHSNDKSVLSIMDFGIGIEDCTNIFDPFFTTKATGIGLGLAMTKTIVEDHFGGTIECTSTLSIGSTFTVRIPSISS